MTEFHVVTWKKKPFEVDGSFTGTQKQIYDQAKAAKDCAFEHCFRKEGDQDDICSKFARCREGADYALFEDKWHGAVVARSDSVSLDRVREIAEAQAFDPWFDPTANGGRGGSLLYVYK